MDQGSRFYVSFTSEKPSNYIFLNFFCDENVDYLKEDIINFDKLQVVAKVIKEFQYCVKRPYVLQSNDRVRDYILNAEVWSEADMTR